MLDTEATRRGADDRAPDENEQIREIEDREWLESLDYVLESQGADRVAELLHRLEEYAHARGVKIPFTANTPYVNTIPGSEQPPYPGSRELERRIKSLIRWNAMAMVVRGNKVTPGIGGHIATYQSAASLLEVGFNHFFRGKDHPSHGDLVYFQGHSSPGIYARAFLEGRLSEKDLENFRRELAEGGGLSSYPHPWLMPGFWEFPTVSMGLGPIMAIYQARFNRYLVNRGLKERTHQKVWAFLGDGETDEPECLGSITLAVREKLDNLIFVINCNQQRLDGPVRGNGQIIQELEATFRGAGWNVIKVIWGSDWDPLFARDRQGLLMQRCGQVVDGEYQKYVVEGGAFIREHFFGVDPRLLKMVEHLSDEQLHRLRRGGHDPEKVYAAFKKAAAHRGSPTVILALTIKGYGMGDAGEARNITHQQKKLEDEHLREFRTRFGIPLDDEQCAKTPFYRPPENSPEIQYLLERRKALGGFLPERRNQCKALPVPKEELFSEFDKGSGDRELSTTMAFVRLLARMLRDPELGRLIVPIVPDEARTFGMEALFRQVGIYSSVGQLYEPVDADSLLYYKESLDGQILEEGITEAGSMSSFIAAGTAYATHGIPTIPFFILYSMFGFQRIGDLIWAAADMRTRGFLLGATSGRTTLNGEGLQHQDGNSHLLAYPVPSLLAYDPAFAYELAALIREGIRRMYVEQETLFYYLTVTNENHLHPAMPEGCLEGILRGIYRFQASGSQHKNRVQLFGSGPIMQQVLKAQELLEEFQVAADVWSVTSYKELRRNALEVERWNRLHPGEKARVPFATSQLEGAQGPIVAATDYVKALPDSIARWLGRPLVSLGTDGFGRSETREQLRDFFEVDHRHVAYAALKALVDEGTLEASVAAQALKKLGISPDTPDPLVR
ncbi:MAG: pyruvate dehydrogenase (acetyl-transferring), homodimeric type [Candidatus Eremiobacterota bacterium]